MNHTTVEPTTSTMIARLVKFKVNVRDIDNSAKSHVGRVIVVNLMTQYTRKGKTRIRAKMSHPKRPKVEEGSPAAGTKVLVF